MKKTRASSLQSQNHFQLKLSRFISISYFANICSKIVEGDVDVDVIRCQLAATLFAQIFFELLMSKCKIFSEFFRPRGVLD